MKRLIIYCFDKWWKPVLVFSLTVIILFILRKYTNSNIFQTISYYLFVIALIGLFLSSIYQFIKQRIFKGILTIGLFGATLIFGFLYMLIAISPIVDMIDETTDNFADSLKIPENIQINIPIDLDYEKGRPDSIKKLIQTQTEFLLYNSFQPGLFEYDFWTSKIESGTIFLKAYEITNNYALSTSRLPERSSIRVYNPSDSIMKFGTKELFTIYEGDWGKPYAAKFEIWFKPDNGGTERKLFEKNYKIEGWMR